MFNTYEDDYVLMHPLRRRIIDELKEKKESYTAKIAKALGMEGKERLIGFHLTTLLKHGFVGGSFGLANPDTSTPKAVKYYCLTEKAHSTLRRIAEELSK